MMMIMIMSNITSFYYYNDCVFYFYHIAHLFTYIYIHIYAYNYTCECNMYVWKYDKINRQHNHTVMCIRDGWIEKMIVRIINYIYL